jgi:hypothetical protein
MLHRLTTPQLETGCARRLAQEGIPPAAADRAAGLIERFLSDGPLTRAQLAGRLQSAGVRTDGQALVFLLFLTSLRGITVRGPMIGKQHAHVLARDWLGAPPAAGPDPGAALGWLARRYLAGHSPATDRDLAKWAGLPLRDARRALREIGGDLDEGEDGLVRLARRPDGATGAADWAEGAAGGAIGAGDGAAGAAGGATGAEDRASGTGRPGRGHRDPRPELALPPPRLLGVFDPLLHGWQSRATVLGPHEHQIVRGGMFGSFALVGGRAVGTWGLPGGQISLTLLEQVSAAHRRALETDAEDVRRFLGLAKPPAP